ncbi:hypothetical protein NYE48_01610 [Paenibacillus sp. FSL M7-1455]|uniref:Uncharacterized protein n=1 Tax=Paenibacillus cookii TaxID=157839 RepID=A0ABQ4LVE8_9BACL|nr:hypothetical protein [Paenibacillus cookii]KHF31760.1 hypothetical protein CM49_06051 [Paenibacillus sp. P1XP2]GIO67255.1 hypothetical protein J21TS3_20760 [Paenibacillus cookii]
MKLTYRTLRHFTPHFVMLAAIIILSIFSITQYRAKFMYEQHISAGLEKDMKLLETTIRSDDALYREILKNGTMTKEQVHALMTNHEKINHIILDYREFAVRFKFRHEDYTYDKSSLTAIQIARLFYDWKLENDSLGSANKPIIEQLQALNAVWLSAAPSEETSFRLSDPSWLSMLDRIETGTLDFLKQHNLNTLEDIWLHRTEVH